MSIISTTIAAAIPAATAPVSLREFSLFSEAGPLAWPLLLISLVVLVFFVERTHFLHRGQIRAGEFLEGIKNNIRQHRLVEALTVCEEAPGPVPRIVKSILLHASEGEARMRSAAAEAAILEIPVMERRVGTIAAMAKLAPLLGLIGTVIALMRAFLAMYARGHYATADAFAHDIAAALGTTALGLIIAAFAHIAHHFLKGRVRSIIYDMERSAHSVIQFLCHELPVENRPRAVVQHESE
ncbi:MAG: MotA/TolQ/ExbB proton channel family protein [Puniceicoccales bacterium]|jgi:biopolymer transport protein ExbB|nr:MotA/TolQ/ExbB proton channel family protein [Puniceicoccales bacterium]